MLSLTTQPLTSYILFQGGRTTRLDRKESYKAQRRSYAKEKKRVERELLSTFKGNSIIKSLLDNAPNYQVGCVMQKRWGTHKKPC